MGPSPSKKKGGFDQDTLHPVYSTPKSVTSLLLGISLQSGFENTLDKPIRGFFPDRGSTGAKGTKDLTLRHVLTMTAGYLWNEMDVPYESAMNDDSVMLSQLDPVARGPEPLECSRSLRVRAPMVARKLCVRTDDMADTVIPVRPTTPSVVTTLRVQAA